MGWLVASHVVNVVVAGIVGILLLSGSGRMQSVYGADAPARRILACLYAIAASSAWALLDAQRLVVTAQVLFPLQILYKLATVFAVRDRHNPVLWWNVGISVLHAVALTKTW
jgi:hypothetical protein